MSSSQDYLQRLADLDAAIARAQPDPDIVVERAAGLIAGRVGCRIGEAHVQLRQIASEQGREPAAVAADVLAIMQTQQPVEAREVRAAVENVLRLPHPEAPLPAATATNPDGTASQPASVATYPAATAPQPASVATYPAATATDSAVTATCPAATTTRPATAQRGPVPDGPVSDSLVPDGPVSDGPVSDGGAGDWTVMMQEVLAGVSGNHTVVSPVRDSDDRVVDFVIVAVTSSVADLSGRRGLQLVGRLVSAAYPAVVGGPVWQAWIDVLRDRIPREAGPFPYEGDVGDATVPLTLVVRMHAVGPGLLSTWVRPDEQVRLSERIAQTERLGNLGWGEWDLLSGKVVWSDELFRIYERDPADGPLAEEESRALRLPEDEPIHQQAAASFGRGETVDMTYRVRIGGRIKHLRTVIDAVRDTTGRPIKVYGIVQDVTVRETSRARLAEAEQQLRSQQMSLAAEHRLAAQLQHIILPIPEAPIDLPGLQAAVRYLPAEQASRVGGDWYHAGGLDNGNVLIAVGDVAGHGLRAATTMARLRHALAALSITSTAEPAELLSHLNRLLRADGQVVDTASAVIARYHPRDGTLVWAQAGHPPPLRTRRGRTAPLDRPAGPLLGAVAHPVFETATTHLRETDLLLLYTDGLIEHRQRTIVEGYAPVIRALNKAPCDQPLAELIGRLRRANAQDDTCILAIRPVAAVAG